MKNSFSFMALMLSIALNSEAQNTLTTTVENNAERKVLLNLLRPVIEKELGIEVVFEVRTLKLQGIWAYGELVPRQKNGQPIDYTKTQIDPEALEAFDDWVCVLWQKSKNGDWTVRTLILGATDLPYGCWWKEFEAPKEIFPYTDSDETCQE
ncbi:MAG: hypothetical protein ACKV1O_00595 [Saprospiraceae bacterium]